MQHLTLRAPGKVNLSLLVGPRRPDGYHDLLTVFAPLALADRIEVGLAAAVTAAAHGAARIRPRASAGAAADGSENATLVVTCLGVAQEENLVTRSLRALEAETGWRLSGEVRIDKRLPMAGGVGGGSSDAAAVLRAAAELIARAGGARVPDADLRRLALSLGADVPFFLDPRPSLARGVGEELNPLPLPALPAVLVARDEPLPTAAVYRAFDQGGTPESAETFSERTRRAEEGWRRLSAEWASGTIDAIRGVRRVAEALRNDLQESACRLLPRLPRTLEALLAAGALAALVSGSGPTVFGLWPTEEEAAGAAARLRALGMDARETLIAG